MKNSPLLACLLMAAACTTGETDQSQQAPEVSDLLESTACYASVVGKDTMAIRMEILGNDVTGELSYNFFEKDDNEGTFRGEMHGDTLLADYTFQSEGTESVRQVAFLQKGEGFVEGYGDMEEQDGKMVFSNTASLTFGSDRVFRKVPCN